MVGPLLALILGDGKQLVTQVVPQALLEFSRGCMRSIFSSLIAKPVYTFSFSRFDTVTAALHQKLLKARERRAVVVASPTSIKSFSLKFIEVLHNLDRIRNEEVADAAGGSAAGKSANGGGIFGALGLGGKAKDRNRVLADRAAEQRALRAQAVECVKVLKLFKDGSLLLDEVDLLLHPLKSELNWPLGKKIPLDFTSSKLGPGLRYEVPFHLLDGLLWSLSDRLVVPFHESREAMKLLAKVRAAVEKGLKAKVLQRTPHLALLSPPFYHREIRPLLASWAMLLPREQNRRTERS